MSYLDNVWAKAGGVDPDLLTNVSNELAAHVTQLTVHQAQIAALQTQAATVTALSDKATALVTRSRDVWGIGLDVRKYTPLDALGFNVPLTGSNFQDALEAAIADAYSRIDGSPPPNIEQTGATYVQIPEGVWPVSRLIRFAGTGTGHQTPGLRGAGMARTILTPVLNFDATNAAVIHGGDGNDDDASFTRDWRIADLTIMGFGQRCIGIRCQTAIGALFENVRVSGFLNTGMNPRNGWGFYFDDSYEDAPMGVNPNMHITLNGCWSERNQGGFYMRLGGPFVLTNCFANQNGWLDCIADQIRLDWRGGLMQGGGYNVDAMWYYSPIGSPRVALGWNHIVRSGSGAGLQASSGGRAGVTGMSGFVAGGRDGVDRFRWLELRRKTNPYAPDDNISGMYLIDQVYDDTAVWIRKATAHAPIAEGVDGLDWWVRDSAATNMVLGGEIYHEANIPAVILFNKVHEDFGEPTLSVNGLIAANSGCLVESRANNAHIVVNDARQVWEKCVIASHAQTIQALQFLPYAFELDEYSREGLMCRAPSPTQGFDQDVPYSPAAFVYAGHIYQGAARVSRRMYSLALECGALAILDARVASTLTLSTTNVTAWASRVNGVSAAPFVAGNYPTYIASDAVFGTPSVQFTGAAPGTNKGMVLAIPADKCPATKHQMSVVVVYRLPDTTPVPAGQMRQIRVSCSTNPQSHTATFGESAGPIGMWSATSEYPGSMVFAPGAADTAAHCAVFGSGGRAHLCLDTDNTRVLAPGWEEYDAPNGMVWPASQIHRLHINATGPSNVETTQTLIVAFAAVIPRGLSWQERQQFIDAAANEFRVGNR